MRRHVEFEMNDLELYGGVARKRCRPRRRRREGRARIAWWEALTFIQ